MNFNEIMLSAHSGLRMLVLLALIVVIVKYAIGLFSDGKWSGFDSTLNRVVPIIVDIQWLVGIVLYLLTRTWANSNIFISVLHPLTMTLAVIACHYFARRVASYPVPARGPVVTGSGTAAPKAYDNDRFRTGLIGYVVTFVLIALGIYFVIGDFNIFLGRND